MNFSSSLMSGMNLSLGGLEIATDFLYGNTDLYEPDLTEVKTTISNKPMREIIRSNKKVAKPKLSRDAIINKYSLIKTEKNKSKSIDDTILGAENTQDLIVDYEDDFDFSFDDENITDANNKEPIENEEDYLDEDSNILYADENSSEEDLALSAASLMQAIASGALTMGQNEQEDEDDEFFIDDDEDDDNDNNISNIEDEINSIDDIDVDDIDDMDDDDIDEVDNEDSENTLESEKNNMNYNTNDDDDLTLLAASSLSYDPDDFDETNDDDEDDTQSTDSDASDEDDINIEDEDDFDIDIEDNDEFDIDDSDDEDNEDVETDDSEEVNLDNIDLDDEDNEEDDDDFDIEDDDNFDIEGDEDEFEIDVEDEDEFDIEDDEDEEDSSDNDMDITIEDEDIADDEEDIADEADDPAESIDKDNAAKVQVQESNVQNTIRESAAQPIKNKQSNADSSYAVEKQKLLKELAYYKKIAQETLNNKTSEKSEIEKMQKKLALIEKKMLSMSSANTNKSTSKLKNDSLNSNNKKVAKAVAPQNNKEKQPSKPVDPYSRYNDMAIDSLFNVVKRFMIENGVNSKLIDISLLNNKFGSANIKRLMSKSYIISIGKGVTIGR